MRLLALTLSLILALTACTPHRPPEPPGAGGTAQHPPHQPAEPSLWQSILAVVLVIGVAAGLAIAINTSGDTPYHHSPHHHGPHH